MVINAATTRDHAASEDGQNWQFCAADRGDLATLKAAQIRQLISYQKDGKGCALSAEGSGHRQ